MVWSRNDKPADQRGLNTEGSHTQNLPASAVGADTQPATSLQNSTHTGRRHAARDSCCPRGLHARSLYPELHTRLGCRHAARYSRWSCIQRCRFSRQPLCSISACYGHQRLEPKPGLQSAVTPTPFQSVRSHHPWLIDLAFIFWFHCQNYGSFMVCFCYSFTARGFSPS